MKRLKNLTSGSLFHNNSGTFLAASSYTEVDETILSRYNDTQLWGWFDDGSILFNDEISDYTNKYEGWHRLFGYAFGIPFLSDPDRSNGFTSKTVQEAIEEAKVIAEGVSLSGVFSRQGRVVEGTWLLKDGIPSNVTGLDIAMTTPYLTKMFFSNELTTTCTIGAYEHDGVSFTLLHTLTITSSKSEEETVNVALTQGKQLALKLITGTAKNVNAGILIKGT